MHGYTSDLNKYGLHFKNNARALKRPKVGNGTVRSAFLKELSGSYSR